VSESRLRLLTEWFGRHRKAAGIPIGSLHILRHTYITIALTEGVPLHIVAARVGDKPETILRTYAHLLPHSDAQAAEAIAGALADKWRGSRGARRIAERFLGPSG
jgi:integrase